MPLKAKSPKGKIREVMREFKEKKLHIGKSKEKVKSKDQAIAIAINMSKTPKKRKNRMKKKPARKSSKSKLLTSFKKLFGIL